MSETEAGTGPVAPVDEDEERLPLGTVSQIIDRAPTDLIEEVLDVPEWGCSVKVKSATAAQNAEVRQRGIVANKTGGNSVMWAEMEICQFRLGVIEPKFSEKQVRDLYHKSGRGFARIIAWLDEKSGADKEELAKAKDEFPDSTNGSEG